MKRSILVAALCACAATPMIASAQFAKVEDAIKYRQSAFFVMGQHFGRINAMLKGDLPWDDAKAKENIAVVNAVHTLPFTAFGAGTEKGHNTKAKPEVWMDADKFEAAKKKMMDAMPKLAAATDKDSIRKAFGDVGGTCKNCHDDFRAK